MVDLQSQTKSLKESKKNQAKLHRTKKFWYLLSIILNHLAKFYFWKKDWVSLNLIFWFLIFPDFSRSLVLSCRKLMRQLLYNIFYIRYQKPIYLQQIEHALKFWKVSKYSVHDCRKPWFINVLVCDSSQFQVSNQFAPQINGLVSIWQRPPSWKG